MRKIIFKKINFIDLDYENFHKIINKKGLFVFPSAPGLASIDEKDNYHDSLKRADYVFFDSGFFVLLLKLLKNINVKKFSGYKFLSFFFQHLKYNNNKSVLSIDPNKKFSKSNKEYLKKLGVKKVYNYLAPKYDANNVVDKKLLKKIIKLKLNYILINIGGGTQEVLGLYLKKNLKTNVTILCTGGAISFFTGDQAPINNLIDRFYLGWFVRLIFNPFTFYKRYLYALKLFPMVLINNIKTR